LAPWTVPKRGEPTDQHERHGEQAFAWIAGDPEPHHEADAGPENDAGVKRHAFGIEQKPALVQTHLRQGRWEA